MTKISVRNRRQHETPDSPAQSLAIFTGHETSPGCRRVQDHLQRYGRLPLINLNFQ